MEKDPKRFLYYAGSLFLVMAAIMMGWQMFGPTWFKNIRAEITSQPYARTITVAAEGKVSAKPDIAQVSFSVVSKASTVKEVTAQNNEKMNAVIVAVKNLGVDAKDILTSQYSLQPSYPDYEPGRVRKIIGYDLNQTITVKVRKLETVDEILDSATRAGANEVGSLNFDIDDTGAVKKEAREKAFAKAREKAEEMASLAGVRLGRVVTFTEETPYAPMPYANFAMEAKSMSPLAAPAPSIEPGSKELNLSVSVTYEIE